MEAGTDCPLPGEARGDVVTGTPSSAEQWRIRITDRCIGSGMCVASSSAYFHQVQGYSQPRESIVLPHDQVMAAVELCPMTAIEIDVTSDEDRHHDAQL